MCASPIRPRAWTALAGGLGLLLSQSAAQASGFAVPESSALSTGTANAVVANPNEPGAFSYNPAAMGFHDKSSVAAGVLLIGPEFTTKTASGTHDGTGAEWIAAPIFQAAVKLDDHWRVGFGANAPFGLETRWQEGTFPALSGTRLTPLPPPLPALPLPAGAHPTTSKLEIISLIPTVTYKVNDKLSLAAGVDYYHAKSAELDSSISTLSGDGEGWGWNAALMYRHEALSFGLSYHSGAEVAIDGDYAPLNSTLVLLGLLPAAEPGSLDLDLPYRLQLGARWQVNPKLAVEFDWTRTGWSAFDELVVTGPSGVIFSDANEWDDANAYRLGATYDISPRTQLRFGYAYDETGQGDDHFSARVPDSDRHLFSLGVKQALSQGLTLEASYMYVAFVDRDVDGTVHYAGLGQDINGSDAVAGDYDASAHLIALELRKEF